MASYKFYDGPLTVESPNVRYTDNEIQADYTYETVTVEGGKVSKWVSSGSELLYGNRR